MLFSAKGSVFSVENRFLIHAGGSLSLDLIVEIGNRRPVDPLFWLIWTTALWLIAGAPMNSRLILGNQAHGGSFESCGSDALKGSLSKG
jgi:hypothetical protein